MAATTSPARPRSTTTRRRGLIALVVGMALFAVAVASVDGHLGGGSDVPETTAEIPDAAALAAADPAGMTATIERAQGRLEAVPGDWQTWAGLGTAQVEQARITGDPTWYDRAEGALEESLALHPEGNDAALAGLGALANARHDFVLAAEHADAALEANAASVTAWGVLADARTQLGDYDGATDAVQQMLDRRPGLAALTRASYDRELHGDVAGATTALDRALELAGSDDSIAWIRGHLGHLAFANGDPDEADRQFRAGLAVSPANPDLQVGLARVQAATGDVDAATTTWDSVVARRPLPEHLAEYATLLMAEGRTEAAEEQFATLDAVQALFDQYGVQDDLVGTQLAADFGRPADALRHARAERDRREDAISADALGWALHVAGRDDRALALAQEATELEGAPALAWYHRGVIEAALGEDEAALRHLDRALETNPTFSPLHAPKAEALRAELRADG